jgi:hydrogenase/urease accessory protein HupE
MVLVLVGLGLPGPLSAHRFAPALLELQEVEAERAAVRWKEPAQRVRESQLRPVLPAECRGIGAPVVAREGTGMTARWEIACPGGLVGKQVAVEGIATSGADVLLRVGLLDGRSMRDVLTGDGVFRIPAGESALDVLRSYSALGVEHILFGFDHLLFVLALVLLVRDLRLLLWTITAFTAGHSLTLALAVLGFVHVPQAPVEAAIAFSIYVLAVEIVRHDAGKITLMQRAPWLVAGAFGLLHGLGFAGALAEVGLPEGEIPLALFAFNLGIEAGQLAFVAVVLSIFAVARLLQVMWPAPVMQLPAYAIGSLAAFWFFERVAGALSAIA